MSMPFPGSSPTGRAADPIAALRIVALAASSMLVLLCVVASFIADPAAAADPLPLIVVAVMGAGSFVVQSVVGYRVAPIDPSVPRERAQQLGLAAFRTTFFLRFAMSEAVGLVGFALTTAFPPSAWPTYLGCAIALLLVVVHVLPGSRSLRRVEVGLNARGALVDLGGNSGGYGGPAVGGGPAGPVTFH